MLSTSDVDDVHKLLSRFNLIPEGETVVANLLRSLEGGVVTRPLAEIVLKAWCEIVRNADAMSNARGFGPVGAESALRLTEAELISSTTTNPLWTAIRNKANDPFAAVATGPVSNLKNLAAVMEHLLGVKDLPDPHSGTGVPIPLSHHTTPAMRKRQADRIGRALSSLRAKPLKTGARIHHRRWFWVTASAGLEDELKNCIGDAAAAKAVDQLGLVHFSRKMSTQSVAERYVLEVKLTSAFAPECAKPSFIFADHNPRFVGWTDSLARSDLYWGCAADLEKFHLIVELVPGCKEMVKATPDQVTQSDILDFVVVGYLDVNRWGSSDVAEGTEVFADRLRRGRSKADVVDSILSFL